MAESNADRGPKRTGSLTGRGRLALLLFGLSFVHGLALNLMPVLFPIVGRLFSVPKAQQGLLQTFFISGMVVALIAAGYLINYLGVKRVALMVTTLGGLGAVVFGLAPLYALVLCGAMLMGMGFAALVAVYAAVITAFFADIRQRMYMWTYAVLAGSATVSTSVVGGLVDRFDYHAVFVCFGILIWAWIAVLFAIAGRHLSADTGKVHLGLTEAEEQAVPAAHRLIEFFRFLADGVLNRGALYILGSLVILDTLASSNLLAWTPTYFGENYKLANIGLVVSASSAGVFVGRLILGALPPGKISDRVLLGICYAGAMFSFMLILLLRPPVYVALGLVGLSGAFVAAQAPTTYSIATGKFGERAPAAIPLVDAMGNLGGVAGPPLLGFMADITGQLSAVLWCIPICGFGLVALVFIWELVDRARGVHDIVGARSEDGSF